MQSADIRQIEGSIPSRRTTGDAVQLIHYYIGALLRGEYTSPIRLTKVWPDLGTDIINSLGSDLYFDRWAMWEMGDGPEMVLNHLRRDVESWNGR